MLRNNRAFALVIALVFALSAAAFGCGDSDSDGKGGSGGTAGAGGSGGGGGDGGSGGSDVVVCGGGLTCAKGEFCNENDECECDPEEDACDGELVCDPIALRCLEVPPEPSEFVQCRNVGEKLEDKNLECVRTAGGSNIWLRMCGTSNDCTIGYTVCAQGHCWANGCGSMVVVDGEETYPNGQFFGECDTDTGDYDPGRTTEIGTCHLVRGGESPIGYCMTGGNAQLGEICRQDYARQDLDRVCAAGLACRGLSYIDIRCESDANCAPGQTCNTSSGMCQMAACEKDEDCGDTGNLYCNTSGVCELTGNCADFCNGGSKETDAEFATCSADPNAVCPEDSEAKKNEYAALYCESPCDPFGGEDACPALGEGEEARARVCFPAPTKENKTGGQCQVLSEEPKDIGETCQLRHQIRHQDCKPGSVCVPDADGEKATCAAICHCDAGFRAGACQASTEQCADDEVCRFRDGISDGGSEIGVCGKK